MVRLGARVSLAGDRGSQAYGATLVVYRDSAGRETKRELRGRDLEVLDIVLFVELDDGEGVATAPESAPLCSSSTTWWSSGTAHSRPGRRPRPPSAPPNGLGGVAPSASNARNRAQPPSAAMA